MQFLIAFQILFKRIKAIRFMLKDKSVPRRKKALVIFGLIYLFLPVDLIPPILFPIAWVDDFILWICILFYLKDTLDKYWMGDEKEDFSKKYKNTIEDVDYEVKKEKD